ncbi:hypothetical protein AAFF_G00247200 [Aldrovandia affinis]|uniref:Uncharacterized protein n=1 Tax=Aldrovandia affinis TaxID=143900 RepID=A0AAD7SU71_9TELE|nr:hypothetical protein AAFF_G00247200 [Aldrovandia affinis]
MQGRGSWDLCGLITQQPMVLLAAGPALGRVPLAVCERGSRMIVFGEPGARGWRDMHHSGVTRAKMLSHEPGKAAARSAHTPRIPSGSSAVALAHRSGGESRGQGEGRLQRVCSMTVSSNAAKILSAPLHPHLSTTGRVQCGY